MSTIVPPPTDAQVLRHKGRHHYAICGEYRPVAGNHECTTCPDVCPECGSRYHHRADGSVR